MYIPIPQNTTDQFFHSASIKVQLWKLGEYRNETQLPYLIDPDWIISQLGMSVVSIGRERTKVWATVDLAKVSFRTPRLRC